MTDLRENKIFVIICFQISPPIWIKFSMLLGTVGLLKRVPVTFGMIYIQGRKPNQDNFIGEKK